ncbi:MAG: alpha/beta hydrolase [Gammaproteobacteria bacterium]|nr:MAG: alpha/beta hydrolase [Gammaproteobacteria bacterium]
MSFANSQGHEIFYTVHGNNNKAIIMISGLATTSDIWFNQIAEFAKEYKVITIDNRGSGQSAKPDEPYTMDIFADDISAVMSAEDIAKAIFVGSSMGGMIIQHFFHKYPEKVDALVLTGTGVGPGDKNFILSAPEALDVISREIPTDSDGLREYLNDLINCYFHKEFLQDNPQIIEQCIAMLTKNPQPEYAHKRQLEACFNDITFSAQLVGISAPTLIIHGDSDKVWQLGNAVYLDGKIPDSRLEVLEKTATYPFIERAKQFNELVLGFIKDLS